MASRVPAWYSVLCYASLPVALARLLWRSRGNAAYRRRWGERFGRGPALPGAPLWLHAVSVGEVNAAVPLIEALQRRFPDVPLLVTTTTPTGSDQLRRACGATVAHCYLAYDTPAAVRRFLDRARPRLAVIMETEIWPNLLAAAQARGIPLLLANARLSERSLRGYARIGRLAATSLRCFSAILAQSGTDAERFARLGAPTQRIRVTGNLKFDAPRATDIAAGAAALRRELGVERRPVWVAGSTHEGEEALLLGAHEALRTTLPDALLIMAPRRPERFDAVAALLARRGVRFQRRSARAPCTAEHSVLLADTMGELVQLYALGFGAFVGGSLVAHGGHNLIEPLRVSVPVLFGPHMDNFRDLERLVLEYGAGNRVENIAQLTQCLVTYATDASARQDVVQEGVALLKDCAGATRTTLEIVAQLLDADAPKAGALNPECR